MGLVTVTIVESVILLLLLSKFGATVEVSRACYGSVGQPCTSHNLRCSSGSIAIQEAFFTDSTACDAYGVASCANISLSSIPLNGARYNFSDTELDSLYRDCSTQETCSHRAGRRGTISLSAIIYQCIIASSLRTITTKTTLTTGRQGTTSTPTSLTSRLFSVVPTDQTTLTHIETGATQTVTAVSTIAGGMFAAGLFAGLAIAAVMVGVVYFFFIRRRCVIKKPDPGPASPNHPTYTGLTDLGRPDTYDVIDRPEAATKPSETSQTPVYQNVNNAS